MRHSALRRRKVDDETFAEGDLVVVAASKVGSVPVKARSPVHTTSSDLLLDISSLDAAKTTLLRHAGVVEPAEESTSEEKGKGYPVWGQVVQVDSTRRTATVMVWKRENTCFVGSTGRPKEEFPFGRMAKLSQKEFWVQCKREFASEHAHYLKLKGEGHDETAPLSLISYNNKLVNQLIERADTGRKPVIHDATTQGKVFGGHRRKMQILMDHTPLLHDPPDPFAEVRDQLQTLASMGIGRVGKKKGRGDTMPSVRQRLAQEAAITAISADTAASFSLLSGSGTLPSRPVSALDNLLAEQHLTISNNLHRSLHGKKMAMQRSFSDMGSRVGSPAFTSPLPSPIPRPQSATSSTMQQGDTLSAKVVEVLPAGYINLASDDVSEFTACFEGLVIGSERWDALDDFAEVLHGKVLDVEVVSVAEDGVVSCDAHLDGSWVHLLLVSAGIARVAYSLLDMLAVTGEVQEKEEDDAGFFFSTEKLKELVQAQMTACNMRRGQWSIDGSQGNFLAGGGGGSEGAKEALLGRHFRPAVCVDGTLEVDKDRAASAPLPSLFDSFFTAPEFHRMVLHGSGASRARDRKVYTK